MQFGARTLRRRADPLAVDKKGRPMLKDALFMMMVRMSD